MPRPRRLSFIPWLVIVALLLIVACELPPTRVPFATHVLTVETSAELQAAIDTMRVRGCVLRLLEPSPTEAGSWAVFECIDVGSVSP